MRLLLLLGAAAAPTALSPAPPRVNKPQGCTKAMGSYCDASVRVEERIANFLSLATLEEKAGLTFGASIDRLKIPKMEYGEALHGVVAGCHGNQPGACPTSFPSALGISASFNETLFYKMGQAIATESRALQPGGGARWAPDVNLFRDPVRRVHLFPGNR
jgi:beta-D-xylosidase 4